ncbi:Mu-like prophage protein gp29 [Desulfonatronum thiosulfatophilum]|uniref:Mu-like prophage protein gp29 n=1 Tax=Desulfonatronum thiosulfatophilum TaxID=617002 RepID=A0A1G6A617_9BACT|nr:DUF935 family protein [Desulfonatronum thiosulfatophilum]SDB03862.1 Mu-like prophage protein gp29 [Desulfonatronum thiosulfatophilum]
MIWDWIKDFASPGAARREELLAEVATRESTGSMDLAGWLGAFPDPDPVLRKRGDDTGVLADLLGDEQVTMAVQQRKLGTLLKNDYVIRAGSAGAGAEPTDGAERLRKMFLEDLERIDLYNLTSEILDAPYFGYTVAELYWESRGGVLRLKDVVCKPRDWFGFAGRSKVVFRSMEGDREIPEFKFLLARHFPTYENPYGLRLLSRCLWPVAFKRGGVQFWMDFCERYGMPWTLATAPAGMERTQRREMAQDLASMVRDAVAVLPSGADVKLEQAQGKGEVHQAMVRHWDNAISKVLIGQTLTSDLSGVGARAASETHYSVLQDYRAADQRMVSTFFTDLGWIYGEINAPGEYTPVWEYVDPDDLDAEADRAGRLHTAGVRFRKTYFERRFGLSEDEFEMQEAGAVSGLDFAANFSSGVQKRSRQDEVDRLAEAGARKVQPGLDGLAQQLLAIVEQAESPEELELLLMKEFSDFSDDEMTEALRQALVAADLYGRWAAR